MPDIEDCFSAADTLEEALSNVHQALNAHLEYLDDQEGVFHSEVKYAEGYHGHEEY